MGGAWRAGSIRLPDLCGGPRQLKSLNCPDMCYFFCMPITVHSFEQVSVVGEGQTQNGRSCGCPGRLLHPSCHARQLTHFPSMLEGTKAHTERGACPQAHSPVARMVVKAGDPVQGEAGRGLIWGLAA